MRKVWEAWQGYIQWVSGIDKLWSLTFPSILDCHLTTVVIQLEYDDRYNACIVPFYKDKLSVPLFNVYDMFHTPLGSIQIKWVVSSVKSFLICPPYFLISFDINCTSNSGTFNVLVSVTVSSFHQMKLTSKIVKTTPDKNWLGLQGE